MGTDNTSLHPIFMDSHRFCVLKSVRMILALELMLNWMTCRRMAVFIQCWYKRRHARRGAAATKLQAALRMHIAARSFQHKRSSALVIQVSIIPAANPLFAYMDTCRVSMLKSHEEPHVCTRIQSQAQQRICACTGALAGGPGEARSRQGSAGDDETAARRTGYASRSCKDAGGQNWQRAD